MKENINSRILWNEAGKAGIVLGGVVIIYSLLVSAASRFLGGLPANILAFLLWMLKFGGCLYLMRFFLVRLGRQYDGVSNRTAFSYGVRIALLSALVCSAYALSDAILHPETVEQAFDLVRSQFSEMNMLDSNSLSAMEQLERSYPAYMFFTQLIYCFLFGTVLAKIYSSRFPQADPFGEPGDKN